MGVLPAANKIIFKLGPNSAEWAMMPQLSRFLAQNQMIVTLFMFPGIAYAMYKTAYVKNRPFVKGILTTMVLTAFLGNITEPMEFSFLFISPVLYIIYILIGATGSLALYFMGTAVGYIRGTTFDFIIFGVMYENSKFYNVIIVGLITMFLSYFIFKWYIEKRNLATLGREEEISDSKLLSEKKYKEIAEIVIEALGGRDNIVHVDNCISRLRIDLKSMDVINREKLKKSGTLGIFSPSKNHIHVVFGSHVEFVRNEIDELI
ncbi:glucose PTS transporter subunit EIIB [Leptotrichia sp. OH3620_COT-345]|uniref:glucose PTS transporter subunit EIIB n=1 Tax=Leptotrichia sp. OH3620_COT-345 TaxID=2491048 RepID=UPI0021011123|nr:glucose PTS transporter subunit EIIB [Leptotrichia sp. OH3620_COT-345]